LPFYTKSADILISAIGKSEFFTSKDIKKGAVLIDVGINKVNSNNTKGYKILGDFKWNSIKELASSATPVPGGIGPMTIAMLVENTVLAAEIYSL
ncbi:MAG: bifunctional 5,10-methylene-tetrahydrofolate dehydrogenase/5,10-methylene-tetrahydrofolate cyclohydrolase, partial [Candidatus Marinimicrobia bacterium]|nr:bifunctional 5,10-methylene-tetrahydrofolate dehydrogenase/5,10-methylene-tetrahydrofolate cyclohydrolase [Candidatus Neomarinimicrobiota bacterium]